MNDTPQHIKDLQLKVWLSKSPADRLRQFMQDNASLFQFWMSAQKFNRDMLTRETKLEAIGKFEIPDVDENNKEL